MNDERQRNQTLDVTVKDFVLVTKQNGFEELFCDAFDGGRRERSCDVLVMFDHDGEIHIHQLKLEKIVVIVGLVVGWRSSTSVLDVDPTREKEVKEEKEEKEVKEGGEGRRREKDHTADFHHLTQTDDLVAVGKGVELLQQLDLADRRDGEIVLSVS